MRNYFSFHSKSLMSDNECMSTSSHDNIKSLKDKIKSLEDSLTSSHDKIKSLEDKIESLEDELGIATNELHEMMQYDDYGSGAFIDRLEYEIKHGSTELLEIVNEHSIDSFMVGDESLPVFVIKNTDNTDVLKWVLTEFVSYFEGYGGDEKPLDVALKLGKTDMVNCYLQYVDKNYIPELIQRLTEDDRYDLIEILLKR